MYFVQPCSVFHCGNVCLSLAIFLFEWRIFFKVINWSSELILWSFGSILVYYHLFNPKYSILPVDKFILTKFDLTLSSHNYVRKPKIYTTDYAGSWRAQNDWQRWIRIHKYRTVFKVSPVSSEPLVLFWVDSNKIFLNISEYHRPKPDLGTTNMTRR